MAGVQVASLLLVSSGLIVFDLDSNQGSNDPLAPPTSGPRPEIEANEMAILVVGPSRGDGVEGSMAPGAAGSIVWETELVLQV